MGTSPSPSCPRSSSPAPRERGHGRASCLPPVVQFLDPRVDQPRMGFALGRCALFHIVRTSFGCFSILRRYQSPIIRASLPRALPARGASRPGPYGLTICVSVALEPLLAASPPYAAPIVCVPAVRLLTVQRAVLVVDLPFLASATAAHLLIELLASVKATLPVGALPVTFAVKVTLAPTGAGFAELVNVVVV